MASNDTQQQVLTVSQLTREIREVLEGRVGSVWVEGEISNHRAQSSGPQYFTLKDEGSQLSCVLFRGASTRAGARLSDGAQVQVFGDISVYEPRGQYQMIVRQVQAKGQGTLQARFEALKRRLYAEGLFDEGRKKAIPRFPEIVALVTSPTGAAVQDMLNILTRRAPWIRVLVYPVRVQGAGAEEEIVRALQVLDRAAEHGLPVPDTIVVGRGGGSLEDLWCFNEEVLARAIAAMRTPVISAVGHEIDFTIADFVADLRAPTPSAAAELLAPDAAELRRVLDNAARTIQARTLTMLDHHERVLELTSKGALVREPLRALLAAEQSADDIESRLRDVAREQLRELRDALVARQQALVARHPRAQLLEFSHQLATASKSLSLAMRHRLDRMDQQVETRSVVLRHLGPEAVLARGFSYTTTVDGRVLKEPDGVKPGDTLVTRLAKGVIHSSVISRS
ncbi:MAG: exodeoxyribonuclease VII large subunit [Verrucomicrobiaceae bacterium]|nr:exodeoxyribonuclease VII large subunit [Verrucomicrobiaceae bacterium]